MLKTNTIKLYKGMKAPTFVLPDIFGNMIDLQNFIGKKVLLSFFCYASCPFCNLRIHRLIEKFPEYHTAGLEIIAVFESPVKNIRKYVGKQKPSFPVLSDPSLQL